MRHVRVFLCLALAVVCLGSGVELAAPLRAASGPLSQAVAPGQVPVGLSPSEWQGVQEQVAKLTAADGTAGDCFGESVSVSGDTAIVGVPGQGVGLAAYVFYRDQGGSNAWGQVAPSCTTTE